MLPTFAPDFKLTKAINKLAADLDPRIAVLAEVLNELPVEATGPVWKLYEDAKAAQYRYGEAVHVVLDFIDQIIETGDDEALARLARS